MQIAYAGTPEFAAVALSALIEAGFRIPLVLSQPDRPAGRGQQMQASPVKKLARAHGIPVFTPTNLRPERGGPDCVEALDALQAAAPDVLVVAAYGLILPQKVLDLPRGIALEGGGRVGALNIHASLLPRWRGAAPVTRAIETGDASTGVTLMQMDAGLDTGPMLAVEAVPVGAQATSASLTAQLARLGADMTVAWLKRAQSGAPLTATPQPVEGVTYASKIEKREAWLDWRRPASVLARQIRAFDPFPGCCGVWQGQTIKVWAAEPIDAADLAAPADPGQVVHSGPDGIVVACGSRSGAPDPTMLRLTCLQRAGGKRLGVRDFLAGLPIGTGSQWTSSHDAA